MEDFPELGFDPHTHFSQFLEEARRHSSNKEVTERKSDKKQQEFKHEKKQSKKKPWKLTVFFSLFKTTDPKQEPLRNPRHPGHVSGPVRSTGLDVGGGTKQRRGPVSGPLYNLFHPKKSEEIGEKIPYVSLDKINSPNCNAKLYGPLYLVS